MPDTDLLVREMEELRKKLAHTEEKYLRLSDATFEAVLIHKNGVAQEVNGNFLKMFGYSLEDILDANAPLFIAQESRELVMKHFAANHDEPYEAVGRRKDGSTLDLEIRCKSMEGNLRVAVIRDISRQKKMQEELNLKALFANLNPGPVIRFDIDGMVQMANSAAKEIFGISEIEGANIASLLPGLEKAGIEACIKNDSLISMSAPVGEKYFQFTLKGVSEMGVVQAYGSDITDHKESENRIRSIVTSVSEAIIMICGEGYVAVWNNAAERIFGYTADEVMGKKIAGFIVPDKYKERHIAGVKKFRDTGETVNAGKTLELSALRKNGEEFPIEISYANPVHLNGRWHAVTVIRDITERKEAETKLKQMFAEQKTILDSAGVGISKMNIENERFVTFEWMNRTLREALNLSESEAVNLPLTALLETEEEIERLSKEVLPLLKKGQTVTFEGNIKRKDGSLFWVRRVFNAVDPSDISKGVITISEDFTKRREMEENLRQAKITAEAATKLKDKFVSLVAHDLQSPFNSILGFLKMALSDKENPLNSKHKEWINRALDSGRALVKMIEELLKISRLQTGKIVPKKKFFDGYLTAGYTISNLINLANEKGVELVNEVPRGTRLFADVHLFGEVIQNLVSNSIKFCNKGDRITIFVAKGSRTTIAVKDTGVGINRKQIPKLFRHEETTSTIGTAGEKGTGLGLPFSNDIMNAHEGSLRVESVEGRETTFYAELPNNRPRVLLVDDDETVRFMFREIMRQDDMDIIEAQNGEEALKLLESGPPDLILTDIEMPVMGGFEFLELLREKPETASTPVIIITSSSDMDDRQKAFQKGANDYVAKPLVLEDLMPRVRRFVG